MTDKKRRRKDLEQLYVVRAFDTGGVVFEQAFSDHEDAQHIMGVGKRMYPALQWGQTFVFKGGIHFAMFCINRIPRMMEKRDES